jgi:hypothetical protein
MFEINAPCRIGDGVHVHVLARRWLLCASASLLSSCFPGNLVVRACKQVHLLVVGCLCLLALQCFAACRCSFVIITACIIVIIIIIINS